MKKNYTSYIYISQFSQILNSSRVHSYKRFAKNDAANKCLFINQVLSIYWYVYTKI